MVLVEFVGGPLDGELRLMPDCRPEWHVAQSPPVYAYLRGDPELPVEPLPPLVYRRRGDAITREVAAALGDPVVYELA